MHLFTIMPFYSWLLGWLALPSAKAYYVVIKREKENFFACFWGERKFFLFSPTTGQYGLCYYRRNCSSQLPVYEHTTMLRCSLPCALSCWREMCNKSFSCLNGFGEEGGISFLSPSLTSMCSLSLSVWITVVH